MTTKLDDGDLNCYAINEELAVLTIKGQQHVLDYSTLIDLLINLATVTSQMENSVQASAAIYSETQTRLH